MRQSKNSGLILSNNKGFTLIEMAIVLIIIGIIIGAVVKGKDVVKSAEQKRLYTTFVREWQMVFNNYYDRTGRILADCASADNTPVAGDPRDGYCNAAITVANLEAQLTSVGLKAPAQGPSGSSLARTYNDSEGILRALTLAFDWKANLGNFIKVSGIPNDLGMAWDRIVDGEMDGSSGDLIYSADTTAAEPVTAVWPNASIAPVANSAAMLRLQF